MEISVFSNCDLTNEGVTQLDIGQNTSQSQSQSVINNGAIMIKKNKLIDAEKNWQDALKRALEETEILAKNHLSHQKMLALFKTEGYSLSDARVAIIKILGSSDKAYEKSLKNLKKTTKEYDGLKRKHERQEAKSNKK